MVDLILVVLEVGVATLYEGNGWVLTSIALESALVRLRLGIKEANVAKLADFLPRVSVLVVVSHALGAPLWLEQVFEVEFSQVAPLAHFDTLYLGSEVPFLALETLIG